MEKQVSYEFTKRCFYRLFQISHPVNIYTGPIESKPKIILAKRLSAIRIDGRAELRNIIPINFIFNFGNNAKPQGSKSDE